MHPSPPRVQHHNDDKEQKGNPVNSRNVVRDLADFLDSLEKFEGARQQGYHEGDHWQYLVVIA